MAKVSIFVLAVFLFNFAQAYPEFIGFGYRSCITCHESGTGGGSLTDYGRGVFATEIAANPFSKWLSREDLSNISNFLGPVELPWYVRTGFKHRTLSVLRSPGSSQSQLLHYNMQNDLNLNFYFNESHEISLINTIGYLENKAAIAPNKAIEGEDRVFMKEYFLKYNFNRKMILYAGFMDKAFGIKTANHTAVNRAQLNLGQNNQVHAVMLQWLEKERDVFFQLWAGNLHIPASDRLVGGSIMLDKKWGDSHAWGMSFLYEKNEQEDQGIVSLHNKLGFKNGNAILAEVGVKSGGKEINGVKDDRAIQYLFTQGNLNLVQGYFLLSDLEYSKNKSGGTALETLKWDIGFLAFPIQRLELRVSAVNKKTYNAPEAVDDQWSMYSQVHLSF